METLNAFLIVFIALMIGIILFYSALKLTERIKKKEQSTSVIFKDFRQKMWMTVGLGVVFFGLYLIVAFLSFRFKNAGSRLDLFFLMYENPIFFIYLGLFIFATITISIYLVRLVIKYFYNRN